MSNTDDQWEDWLEMTEAEQDAVLERSMREYEAMLDSMPLKDRVRHHIRSNLETCRKWRTLAREYDMDFAKRYLKQCQLRLVKLRIWRHTGIYPGSA